MEKTQKYNYLFETKYARPGGYITEITKSKDERNRYPESHNTHMWTHEGDHRHVIMNAPHNEKTFEKIRKATHREIHKHIGDHSKKKASDMVDDVPLHHQPMNDDDHKWMADAPDRPHIHKSIADYAKYMGKSDGKWVNANLE